MKRFMYLSIGVLCLMLAVVAGYHLGSQSAQAQVPEPITAYRVVSGSSLTDHFVMLSNGDVYRQVHDPIYGATFNSPPTKVGNFWTGQGGAVPTSNESWGTIKDKSK